MGPCECKAKASLVKRRRAGFPLAFPSFGVACLYSSIYRDIDKPWLCNRNLASITCDPKNTGTSSAWTTSHGENPQGAPEHPIGVSDITHEMTAVSLIKAKYRLSRANRNWVAGHASQPKLKVTLRRAQRSPTGKTLRGAPSHPSACTASQDAAAGVPLIKAKYRLGRATELGLSVCRLSAGSSS